MFLIFDMTNVFFFSIASGDNKGTALRTDGSTLSPQLFSQLDEARVGDVFFFQPKLSENEEPNFEAVFVEELTLSRIAYKMQVRTKVKREY